MEEPSEGQSAGAAEAAVLLDTLGAARICLAALRALALDPVLQGRDAAAQCALQREWATIKALRNMTSAMPRSRRCPGRTLAEVLEKRPIDRQLGGARRTNERSVHRLVTLPGEDAGAQPSSPRTLLSSLGPQGHAEAFQCPKCQKLCNSRAALAYHYTSKSRSSEKRPWDNAGVRLCRDVDSALIDRFTAEASARACLQALRYLATDPDFPFSDATSQWWETLHTLRSSQHKTSLGALPSLGLAKSAGSMGISHNQAQRSTSAPGGRMHTFEVGDTVQGRYYGEDDGEMKWYAGIVVSAASSRVEVKFDADRKVDSFRLPEDANRKGFVRVLEANVLLVTKPTTHVFIGGLVPVA